MKQFPFDLTGKTILVTGASSGIGREICLSCSKMGGSIIATGRDKNRLEETLSLMEGEGHSYLMADLANFENIKSLVGNIQNINGIVHAAGIINVYPVKFISQKWIDEIMSINFYAPVLLNQQLVYKKKLLKESSIVFLSSISSLIGSGGMTLYSSTKAAINAASRVTALELASLKIRSNCVAPGIVRTQMTTEMEQKFSSEQLTEHEKLYPLGFGHPEDVANVVVFLLSEASRWITGSTIIVDGGFSIK